MEPEAEEVEAEEEAEEAAAKAEFIGIDLETSDACNIVFFNSRRKKCGKKWGIQGIEPWTLKTQT